MVGRVDVGVSLVSWMNDKCMLCSWIKFSICACLFLMPVIGVGSVFLCLFFMQCFHLDVLCMTGVLRCGNIYFCKVGL